MKVGKIDGVRLGTVVGLVVDTKSVRPVVGTIDGSILGLIVGIELGGDEGYREGYCEGKRLAWRLGFFERPDVGIGEKSREGNELGMKVDMVVGFKLGYVVGLVV